MISFFKKKWRLLSTLTVLLVITGIAISYFHNSEEEIVLQPNDYIDIQISSDQQKVLERCLAQDPIKKKWVKVKVSIDQKSYAGKIKFHGTSLAHYNDGKYSYSVKLSKGFTYHENGRKFKLIKSSEADPTIIAINETARSLGLISTSGSMKVLRINGIEKGVYYFVEDIKKEYLERELGITNYSTLVNVSDWTRKENISLGVNHISENDLHFTHIERKNDVLFPKALNEYRILAEYIKKGNVEEVKKRFDVEYMGKFLCLLTLFNDVHFITGDNLKLVYDFNRGKFYPIYRAECEGRKIVAEESATFPNFNNFLFESLGHLYASSVNTQMFKLLLSDNSIRNSRDKHLYKYIQNRSEIMDRLKDAYVKNENVMSYEELDYAAYDIKRASQKPIVNSVLNVGEKYMNYAQIYMSYDSITHRLSVLLDSYVPIDIYHQSSDFKKLNINGIELDASLEHVYNYQDFHVDQEHFNPKELIFINSVTKDTISKVKKYLNFIDRSEKPVVGTTEELLDKNSISYTVSGKRIVIHSGAYSVTSDVIIREPFRTTIEAGVTFKMGPQVNFCINGSADFTGSMQKPITIKKLDDQESFGCFSIVGNSESTVVNLNYVNVSGGSESYILGRTFTGQFAIYNANVILNNSTFQDSRGDDGLNIKYSKVEIENCTFSNNFADQVDLDFCFSIISNCDFSPSRIDENGDGLDLSGSYANIINCNFSDFLDKGLSLGENSKVLVSNCSFNANLNGIAIKDQTKLFAWSNEFNSNTIDYLSFIKKAIFNGPDLFILDKTATEKMKILQGTKHNTTEVRLNKEKSRFMRLYKDYSASNKLSAKLELTTLIEQD